MTSEDVDEIIIDAHNDAQRSEKMVLTLHDILHARNILREEKEEQEKTGRPK